MKRSGPISRTTPLRAKGRIKAVNTKRKAKRFESDFGGKAYRDYIVAMPCAICGVHGHSDPAHVKSRGSGGKAADQVPLCHTHPSREWADAFILGCHTKFDEHPWTLPEGTEERLMELAAKLYADFHAAQPLEENEE